LGDSTVCFRLVEQVGFLRVSALQLDIRLSGKAGKADIGLRRSGNGGQTVDLCVGNGNGRIVDIDIDAPNVTNLDAVEEHGAAASEAGGGSGNAHAQRRC